MVNFMPWPLPLGKEPRHPLNRRLGVEKRINFFPCQETNLYSSAVKPIASCYTDSLN
jgi:hypothetical protein